MLTIENYSKYPAVGVWLYDTNILPKVEPRKQATKRISFKSNTADGVVYIGDDFIEMNDKQFPYYLDLIYSDIDRNIISQKFKYTTEDTYEACELEY